MKTLEVRHCGILRYDDALAMQRDLHARRIAGEVPDTLMLVEHPHVLTAGTCGGRADRWENLTRTKAELEAEGVDLHESDRGGDITWHGPGQLVGYPILDLNEEKDLGAYVRRVEEVQLLALKALGVEASRVKGMTGVWIGNNKITAIGIRLRKWVSMHGFAMNLEGPLEGFDWIVPCGLKGKGVTSVERELGYIMPRHEMESLVLDAFKGVFGYA